MPTLSKTAVIARLCSVADSRGVKVASPDIDTLTGELELNLGKWILGGRKLNYRLSCRLDEGACAVRFRESVTESSWGVPPPSLKVETTGQRGTRISGSTTTTSVGGAGRLDYGALREAFESAATSAGWQFTFEAGRRP